MSNTMMQRTQSGPRSTPWLSCAWHKRVLLGVFVVLMSLCHGVVVPVAASTVSDGAAVVSAAENEQPPFRDCAASKRLIALSERRGSAATLDLPASASALTAHLPEAARGLRVTPLPIPGNHRAFLQVFRI